MSLYVDESGTPGAPGIVFLHGAGTSGWMWGGQLSAFSDHYCLNIDLPGHGKSNRVPWLSLADTADQVAAIIRERAANGRAHIVGLSLGGYVALVLLERHADVVERVVVSGVTAAPMPGRAFLKPQLALMGAVMQRRWFANMSARRLGVTPDLVPAFTENLMAMSMDAYRRLYEDCANYALPDALRRITVPTLVTAGSKEVSIILQAVESIPTMMPNAEGRLAPGVGHGWNFEAPDLFNAMLRAWFTGTALPPGLIMPSVSRSAQSV